MLQVKPQCVIGNTDRVGQCEQACVMYHPAEPGRDASWKPWWRGDNQVSQVKGEHMKDKFRELGAHMTKRVAVVTAVFTLAMAGVAGGAFALTASTQAPAPTSTSTTPPGSTHAKGSHVHKAHHRNFAKSILRRELRHASKMARHAIGVQVTLHTKSGDKTVEVERGTVTALSSTSITIKRIDGQSFTATLSTTTHEPRKAMLKDGAHVVLVESAGHATLVLPMGGLGLGHKPSTTPKTPTGTSSVSGGSGAAA